MLMPGMLMKILKMVNIVKEHNFIIENTTITKDYGQCSPEAPAASVFAGYSCIKRWLLLLDRSAENYALVSVK